jgi:UDP-N-acetylmuramoyl-tripeptide--D-alanyl-D-alanine ligase
VLVRWRLGDWVAAAGGRLENVAAETPVTQLAVDSREAGPGVVFAALPGRFGHGRAYAADAVSRGAAAVLLEAPPVAGLPCWLHPDPLEAMAEVGRLCLRRVGSGVVGVTGSVGKTSTKLLIAAVLAAKYPVQATPRNYNTRIGLPIALTGLAPGTAWFVAEMAMRARGEIFGLTRIAPPDVAVMTNIGPAHLSELGSMEAITEAKAEILAGMRPGGVAVLNRDDPRIVGLAPRVKGRIVWYGAGGGDVQVDQVTSGPGWVRCRIRDQEGEVQATIPWDGAYQALNMAAAAAVGRVLGLTWDEVATGFRRVEPEAAHFRRRAVGSLVVLDDTYNASPASMAGGLEVLARETGRRVAVLGDMLELGALEETAHRQAGEQAARAADAIVAVGPRARWLAEAAQSQGANVTWMATWQEALDWCRRELRPGDRVYVKASRAMGLDALVEALVRWGGPA